MRRLGVAESRHHFQLGLFAQKAWKPPSLYEID